MGCFFAYLRYRKTDEKPRQSNISGFFNARQQIVRGFLRKPRKREQISFFQSKNIVVFGYQILLQQNINHTWPHVGNIKSFFGNKMIKLSFLLFKRVFIDTPPCRLTGYAFSPAISSTLRNMGWKNIRLRLDGPKLFYN